MSGTAIPVDAVVAQALEKRPTYSVGSVVWVRRSDNGLIEMQEVIGLVMVMTNAIAFHLHYLLAVPKHSSTSRVILRRMVPWHHVYPTHDDAVKGGQVRPSNIDPLESDIELAVQTHRKQFGNVQRRA